MLRECSGPRSEHSECELRSITRTRVQAEHGDTQGKPCASTHTVRMELDLSPRPPGKKSLSFPPHVHASLEKEDMVHPIDGILPAIKRARNLAIWDNLDGPRGHT